ncbi:MAG: NAD+ synthase [Rhodospirillaceae bacterium]|nr:NAD+ synthase [Rhodospirillaceae bacterium]
MTESLNIALAQINPRVGDVDGNIDLIRKARAKAAADGCDLIVTGELVVSGYPPEDLVLKPAFQDHVEATVKALAKETNDGGPALLIGAPWRQNGDLYNAALLLDEGRVSSLMLKHVLPNYGVFDEMRVFTAGPAPGPLMFRDVALGVMICEDMWTPDVTECLDETGADILVVLNGSPFEVEKTDTRLNLATARTLESALPLIYVNLIGGQDELVFDGDSFVLSAEGEVRAQLGQWESQTVVTEWHKGPTGKWTCEKGPIADRPGQMEAIYRTLVQGLRDYVQKSHFPGVLIGMSGGIDSALSAAVAVDALGPDAVHCVMMPSPYTSNDSLEDAAAACGMLGARLDSIGIGPAMKAFEEMLSGTFEGTETDTTEENIQARSRGITLMAISNKLGYMVLSTGNKSEMSVGYATLYGDMCGGDSVLKDVYKTTVFELSRWRNENKPGGVLGPDGPVMPMRIITKPPSAELKPDQTDQDTLPDYAELDDILHCLIEQEMSRHDIAARGHDMAIVQKIWRMLDRAEYKRRQAPPGVKISDRAFGRDRRYPITNAFTGQ